MTRQISTDLTDAVRNTDAEGPTISVSLGALQLARPNFNHQFIEIIQKQTGDISELKEQLDQKNTEIQELQKQVKKLVENNNNLVINLEAKDTLVKSLKERIQVLEEEKKKLQEELATVKFKLKSIDDEVKKLGKSRESEEERSTKLEGEMKKIQFAMKEVKDDLATTKTENETLKKEVRHQARYVAGAPLRLSVPASDQQQAMRYLGEMCCQIQDAMYKKILPEHFIPLMNYKVKCFNNDMEKLSKTEVEKEQALKRWKDVKMGLRWNEDIETALGVLESAYSRNVDNNPPTLVENDLRGYAEFLEGIGVLKGWLSLGRVRRLIDVWKRLVECGTIALQA